ncbi:hypothetical protein ACN2WE_05005 [Streptomyces sp. cg28]|uniref:hypothetical protein n=1 Tax=Streptomyces sp. cg28 TaxID=3403457 RepID=UPI003B20C473
MAERLTLGALKRLTNQPAMERALTTTAEWDVTPGLHEWIEGEIRKAEAEQPPHDPWCSAHPPAGCGCGMEPCDCDGFDSASCDCPWPARVARRRGSDRKILAAHPYTTRVINPSYGKHTAGFGCETCHDWDGVPEGRGNCPTILALAEAYGLDPAGEQGVEVRGD